MTQTPERKFKEYRYLYVHVRDIHSEEDYLKIRQTKLKGLKWFCDRCECWFVSEAVHKAIECRKYREMAGIDEPDALQWSKPEGKVTNGKFTVKGKGKQGLKSITNVVNEGEHDEEGRIIPVDDKEADGRDFPCPECDFVFLRNVFQIFTIQNFHAESGRR